MKKIILSVAVATMALSTAAAALEDIKVNGQAKLWYETNNAGVVSATDKAELFNKTGTMGETAFKLGITGKQGNVGFGATFYQLSSLGLTNVLVSATRSGATYSDGDSYTGEMYITAPVGAKTLVKIGKQELDTPLAFTERWALVPNAFNAAVAINNSIDNVTLIGAFVGQSNGSATNVGTFNGNYAGTTGATVAAAALYKNDGLSVNVWAYSLESAANGYWLDAGTKVSGLDVKGYAVFMDPKAAGADSTKAFAGSVSTSVSGIQLFAAASDVSYSASATQHVGNTATGNKKTKLPTAGVYTDGLYVAQMGSTALKVKASGKVAGTGLALQIINNSNSEIANVALETTEIDLIATKKIGDFNFKAILMDRSFDDAATDATTGGQHVRVIASVNF